MPRTARSAAGGWIFHVLNRANGRGLLFESAADYGAFVRQVGRQARTQSMRVLAFCAMPNHWHMLLWPEKDGDLASFLQRVTQDHTARWHGAHGTKGRGHLYQSRFKSFAVRDDRHLLTVCRYIERNPLRANLVSRAELWPWSSAAEHSRVPSPPENDSRDIPLASLPIPLPSQWAQILNEPQTQAELDAIRNCIRLDDPFGDPNWQDEAAAKLGLARKNSHRGRPRKR